MSTLLEHRGYVGSVEYSDQDEVFFGRLEFIRDLVTYEGADAKSLKAAFHDAVADYLETCAAERENAGGALERQLQRPPRT